MELWRWECFHWIICINLIKCAFLVPTSNIWNFCIDNIHWSRFQEAKRKAEARKAELKREQVREDGIHGSSGFTVQRLTGLQRSIVWTLNIQKPCKVLWLFLLILLHYITLLKVSYCVCVARNTRLEKTQYKKCKRTKGQIVCRVRHFESASFNCLGSFQLLVAFLFMFMVQMLAVEEEVEQQLKETVALKEQLETAGRLFRSRWPCEVVGSRREDDIFKQC